MRSTLDLVFAATALSIGGLLGAQQTLTVGPGQTYATLGAAIAAAMPGDTVLAVGGSYLENVDIDKSLQLVGQGARMRNAAFPASNSIHVHDLGPGEAVVVRGFVLESGSARLPIAVERCEGPVALHDFANQGGTEFWSLYVGQSSQVHAARNLFHTVRAVDAVLSLEQCVIDPPSFSPALWSQSSAVALVQCTANGPAVPGGAAVWLDGGGSLLVTRSTLTPSGSSSMPMPAIHAFAGCEVLVDPSSSLGSIGGSPAVTGTVPVSFEFASLRASSNGSVLTAAAHGPANEVFVTVFSALAPAVATPWGLTWLDLATFSPLYAGIYDPTTRTHIATIAHAPAPPGLAFALQAVGLGSNGLALGLPTMLTMP